MDRLKRLVRKIATMNSQILFLREQIIDTYEGEPWFGRNAKELLSEVNEHDAFQKLAGEHSILELVWHMITWREFTISRIKNVEGKDLHFFEQYDWRELDHNDKKLWRQGLERLKDTQNNLIKSIEELQDDLLEKMVAERNYNFKKLLHGIIQHDIYHLGQIAYINKMLFKAQNITGV